MTDTEIVLARGYIETITFDKSFYTDDHDVPITTINNQVIAIGDGYDDYGEKIEGHLRWKLHPMKQYEIIIREVEHKRRII